MKKLLRKWFKLLIVLALVFVLFVAVAPVHAQEAAEPPSPVEAGSEWFFALLGLVPVMLNVAGAGGIVGAVIDLAKLTGKLKDGYATRISLVVNFILWAVLWWAGRYGMKPQVETAIANLGIWLPGLITFLGMIGAAKFVHGIMKWLDKQSFSLSSRLAGVGFPQKLAELD